MLGELYLQQLMGKNVPKNAKIWSNFRARMHELVNHIPNRLYWLSEQEERHERENAALTNRIKELTQKHAAKRVRSAGQRALAVVTRQEAV